MHVYTLMTAPISVTGNKAADGGTVAARPVQLEQALEIAIQNGYAHMSTRMPTYLFVQK